VVTRLAVGCNFTQILGSMQNFWQNRRLTGGTHLGILAALAAICAYAPLHAFGLRESFWSAITAIGVVQTEFGAAEDTAKKQFFGAAVGGITGLVMVLLFNDHLLTYAFAVLIAVALCWLLNISSSSQLAGITATIILLVPRTGPAEVVMLARVFEVSWGVVVGVIAVWLSGRLAGWSARRRREI
jgi:uncharacterized membrane protein YccC